MQAVEGRSSTKLVRSASKRVFQIPQMCSKPQSVPGLQSDAPLQRVQKRMPNSTPCRKPRGGIAFVDGQTAVKLPSNSSISRVWKRKRPRNIFPENTCPVAIKIDHPSGASGPTASLGRCWDNDTPRMHH